MIGAGARFQVKSSAMSTTAPAKEITPA